MKKQLNFKVEYNNRTLYTLVAIGILIVAGWVVWAYTIPGETSMYNNPSVMGHSWDEMECNDCINLNNIGPDAVGSSEIVDGSISNSDIDSSEVQQRVTGNCNGQVVVGIGQDGQVQCEQDNVGESILCPSCGGSCWSTQETSCSPGYCSFCYTYLQLCTPTGWVTISQWGTLYSAVYGSDACNPGG